MLAIFYITDYVGNLAVAVYKIVYYYKARPPTSPKQSIRVPGLQLQV